MISITVNTNIEGPSDAGETKEDEEPQKKMESLFSSRHYLIWNDSNTPFSFRIKMWSRLSNNHKTQEEEKIQDYLDTCMYMISTSIFF